MFKEFSEILTGFSRVSKFLEKKEKLGLAFATILMIVGGFLTNIPAVILGNFVDKIINLENTTFNIAIPYLILIIVLLLFKETITVVRKYIVENTATQTEKKVTISTIEHILKTDVQFIDSYQIGSLHGRIFRSIEGLIRLIKLGFLEFFPILFSAIAALSIAFYKGPALAGVMILVIPAGLFIVIKQISSQKGIRIKLLRGKEQIDGKVVEMLSGLETIRVANTIDYEVEKVEKKAENLRKIEIKHHIWMSIYDAAKYLNESFFYVLVIALSVYFAINGMITKGDILTYSILFMSVLGPLREIHRILDHAHESSIKVKDLYNLQQEPIDRSFRTKDNKLNLNNKILEIKKLSYTYSSTKEKVLNSLSIEISQGEKIGIVGSSGCGKSTLIKILLRLLHNYKGEVKVLGSDLQNVSRKEIGNLLAYVPQKTYIFSGTIKENIIYGCNKKISKQEIIDSLKKVNLYDEVINKLGGLNGKVSEQGNNLSGGQKQRLALARLILKSPEIFILDEATSALDNKNERIIQTNIEKLFPNKTIIMIAHRLTTLKNCDRILVLEKGSISQVGTFDELSKKTGLFKEFLEQK